MSRLLTALALSAALPTSSVHAVCASSGRTASVEEIVAQVKAEGLKYVFVGERHGIGPVKKFAVDLTNALVESGYDVGLYVEGFRTDCPPRDEACWSLARAFNRQAFLTLLDESKASVHPIDPPEGDRRAERMAATIAAGSESVRVVLVGRSHVIHAENREAELWVYGGGLRYPDPGDVAEAFPRHEYLTVGLETGDGAGVPYSLQHDECGADYVLITPPSDDYWTPPDTSGGATASTATATATGSIQ